MQNADIRGQLLSEETNMKGGGKWPRKVFFKFEEMFIFRHDQAPNYEPLPNKDSVQALAEKRGLKNPMELIYDAPLDGCVLYAPLLNYAANSSSHPHGAPMDDALDLLAHPHTRIG